MTSESKSNKQGIYKLATLFFIFILFASAAQSGEQFNLGSPNILSAVNVSTVLNLTYLSQNAIPYMGSGGQVTQDTANFTYFTANGTMVITNISVLYGLNTTALNVTGSGNSTFTGKVGIGTTAPALALHVDNGVQGNPLTSGVAQNGALRLRSGSNIVLDFGAQSSGWTGNWIQSTDRTDLSINYSLILNPNGGNVGIGTTNPGDKLDVAGNIRLSGATTTLLFSNLGGYDFSIKGNSGDRLDFLSPEYSASPMMSITNGGNVGIGNTSPSNILAFAIASATDPIADSWQVYPSDAKHKDIKSKISDSETKYLEKAKKWVAYNWTRKPIATKEEAVSALGGKKKVEISSNAAFESVEIMETIDTGERIQNGYSYDDAGNVVPIYTNKTITQPSGKYKKQLKSGVTFNSSNGKFYQNADFTEEEIEVKKQELSAYKATLPKFTTERVGALMDDPEVPKEVLVYDEYGTVVGYDLAAFILYQQELIRELAVQLDKKADKSK